MNIRKLYLACILIIAGILSVNAQAVIQESNRTEPDLYGGTTIHINLGSQTWEHQGSIDTMAFTLMDAPAGVVIVAVNATDNDDVDVSLIKTQDYDVDSSNAYIVIQDSVIAGSTGNLTTNTIEFRSNQESAGLTSSEPLTERNMDGTTYIHIDLSEEQFVDYTTLATSDFKLVNFPDGIFLTIFEPGPNDTDIDDAEIYIDFTSGDIDNTITDAYIEIIDTVLRYSTENLATGFLEITGTTETVDIFSTVNMDEWNLNNAEIVLELDQDETLAKSADLDSNDFWFFNFPPGTSIESIRSNSTGERITIDLGFDYTDFDSDISNARIAVKPSILSWNKTDSLSSGTFTILANDENPRAYISPDDSLKEYTLGERSLAVKLTDDWIINTGTFDIGAVNLDAGPTGLDIENVTVSDSSEFIVELSFDYNDFDIDEVVRISIAHDSLFYSSGTNLVSNDTIAWAKVEIPVAEIEPFVPLQEYDLDGKTLVLVMEDEWIIDTGLFDENHIDMVDPPPGVLIESVLPLDTNTLSVVLRDTIVDFDVDTDLEFTIDYNQLVQSISIGSNLISDTNFVDAYVETPVATVTPGSWLREFFLDGEKLDIEFAEEMFSITPVVGDFGFNGAPDGLTVEGLESPSDSSITLVLGFDEPNYDFDIPYSNVSVTISNDVLVQTESGSLVSIPFEILPNIEPVIGGVTLDDTAMIGEVVEATVTLSGFTPDSVYTLGGGTIGGYAVNSIEWVSDDVYNARFTITEGGADYSAPDPVPVVNLRFNDPPVVGVNYTGSISQFDYLLDANKPVVQTLAIIGQAAKHIGDDVIILISAFEEGLVPEDSTEVNLVPMTSDNVVFEEIGGGTYTLTYTIDAGDQNVGPGALEAKVYLRDYAGNVSEVYPAIDVNTLSIDASIPVIANITNITPADTVIIGGEVILAVQADEAGYSLAEDSEVNGKKRDEGLTFSSVGSTYQIRYPVEEDDPIAQAGELKAMIILEDSAGNRSTPDSVILSNDVAVLTARPTALLTGYDEICIGETAALFITLVGEPPWKLKYHDSIDSYYAEDIDAEFFSIGINPTRTMSYSIDSVWDGTGNENTGIGNSVVIVNPLPVVSILNLDTIYAVTDTAGVYLEGFPADGDFFGPGVITQQSFFSPPEAGLTGIDPHKIWYEYTDIKGCFSTDTVNVQIVEADVTFSWPNPPYNTGCYFDESYTLIAQNTAFTQGSFFIEDAAYPPGFMVDNGNNTATFNPSILDWTSGEDYDVTFTIRYDYKNENNVDLFEKTTLTIDYFDTAYIVTDLAEYGTCTNSPLIPITVSRSAGWFEGKGILDPDAGGNVYEFDPAVADTGTNWIYYNYLNANQCLQRDSAVIIVNEAPDPGFIFLDSCVASAADTIFFKNVTDTSGLGGTLKWNWVYDDIPSGDKNRDEFYDMQNGSHRYPGPGRRTIDLTATVMETGCYSTESITKDLGETPTVSIDWNTECFSEDPIEFTGSSITDDPESTFRWRITDMSGNEIKVEEGPTLDNFDFTFATRDNYAVEFTSVTENGCFAIASDTIYLRPYIRDIADDAPYIEDFEGNTEGWFAFAGENSPQMSWTLDAVNSEDFPFDLPDEGIKAWYTKLADNDTAEQSWVTSPCFDLSTMRRPMIRLDRKISSDRDRDGATLQYTVDDGATWNEVGAVDDGSINWYNSFRISNGPGGQGEGWTGGFVFDPDEVWKQSRHDLDELIGRDKVQFRIAYGASSDDKAVENKGFAFDNIWIGERSRVVLIEHFTNSGLSESNDANEEINLLVRNNPLDVIDIQYHTEVDGFTDKMNEDNSAPASARSLFYGTRQVPYMLMDGGLAGEMTYDFNETLFDTLDLFTRVLDDPSFEIGLDVQELGTGLELTIDITALETMSNGEYIVYIAIVENIDNVSYVGAGFVQRYDNVVRAMVPNPAGISLIREWNPGDTEKLPAQTWNISDKIPDMNSVSVVVFIQGAENHEVYQAASNDSALNGNPAVVSVREFLQENGQSMMIYPNPARSEVYLAFAETLSEKVEVQVFTHTGSLVRNRLLPAGTETYSMNVNGLEKGVYIIRAIQKGRIIGTHRLMIIR